MRTTTPRITEVSRINQPAIEDEPCGCPECDEGIQPGHFACEVSAPDMLQLEREKRAFRAYDDGRWRWIATQ